MSRLRGSVHGGFDAGGRRSTDDGRCAARRCGRRGRYDDVHLLILSRRRLADIARAIRRPRAALMSATKPPKFGVLVGFDDVVGDPGGRRRNPVPRWPDPAPKAIRQGFGAPARVVSRPPAVTHAPGTATPWAVANFAAVDELTVRVSGNEGVWQRGRSRGCST